MAKRSKVHPTHKRRYRVTKWPYYARALAERGSLTVWFSPDAVKVWTAGRTGQRGGQRRYSDLAARTALRLRLLHRLPWRQTEGLLRSLVQLMGLELAVPDHTTLSRRSRHLATKLICPAPSRSMHLVVDASGHKVFGQGEWAAARYGGRPMGWRKLHLAVDQAGSIVAIELTDNNVADATVFRTLLDQTDEKVVRQARAETAFYRFKRCFGPAIRARDPRAQRVQVMTACNLLNRMSSLGRPVSQRLAA